MHFRRQVSYSDSDIRKSNVLTLLVEFIVFASSAASSVSFSSHIIRAAKGVPETLKINCGFSTEDGIVKPAPLEDQWVNKGLSIATISG